MVWNIKYGTLQSWQTLDKLTARQNSVQRLSQTTGAYSVCSIPGFICVGFCHSVAVCHLSLDACSLASALGQLDSTAKYVFTEVILTGLFSTVFCECSGSVTPRNMENL